MIANKRICMHCNVPMIKATVKYKGMEFESRRCPKCKENLFTEDLAMKAINQLETKRLEDEYVKHPIKVGNSWGLTFPKEVTEVFGLNHKGMVLKIHPDVGRGKIEILLR